MILCTFRETFLSVFIYCFPMKKNLEKLIYRIEIWLYLQVIWLETFYKEESLTPCTIQPSGFVYRASAWIKASICPLGDGLWLEKIRAVAKIF